MLKRFKLMALLGFVFLAIVAATPAMAGFSLGGYTPQVVQSGTGLNNGATFFQSVRLWDVSGAGTQVNTSLTLPSFQTIDFARLYLDVYGGTAAYTGHVAVTVNGHALSPINVGGGASDTNPTFDATKTCVYGSGVGQWQLAIAGVSGYLKTDGSANNIGVLVTSTSGNFDGRLVDASLVGVYQDSSVHQKLDYYLAEGDGYMRKPPASPTYGNAPYQRQIAFNGLNTASVISATYTTLYTHGDAGQADRQYFNGNQLGSNDVAIGAYGQYGPDLTTFNVASFLTTNSAVLYDANTVGSTAGETSILAKIELLDVTHPLPEPATLTLLMLAGVAILRRRTVKA